MLATGLSGLYSSLPTKLEEKGEEWHCLLKDDWLVLPSLVQFMNSLEFCNAVIQVPSTHRPRVVAPRDDRHWKGVVCKRPRLYFHVYGILVLYLKQTERP